MNNDDRDTNDDDIPGDQPVVAHVQFEEWADPDDRRTVVVAVDGVRTPEGRVLRVGDLITPREARQLRLRSLTAPSRRAGVEVKWTE